MKKVTLLLHIDALRHDYITKEEMPFLFSLSQNGISARLIPPFGFEPDGAYLTGTFPEVYQGGVHFIYNEGNEFIPFHRYFPKYLDTLSIYVQYPFRKLLQFLIKKKGATGRIKSQPFIGQIPFRFLEYFYFNDVFFTYEENFCKNANTIFDYIRAKDKKYFIAAYPKLNGDSSEIKKYVLNYLNDDYDFAFLMFTDLDFVGHKYGPTSIERKKTSRKVDENIHKIYKHLTKYYDIIDFIGFGDHGMVQVNENIDLLEKLKGLPLVEGIDYFYFLDSTFARFWFKNKKAENIISDFLKDLKCGSIVSDYDKMIYGLNYSNRKFGDLIFWMDSGRVIYPNFWHARNPPKGMHGYRKEVLDNHSAFIYNSMGTSIKKNVDEITMGDVFQTTYYSLFDKKKIGKLICGNPVQQMGVV